MRAARNTIIGMILLAIQTVGYGQDEKILPLSLAEALDLARKQNYQLRVANSEVQEANGKNLESWSGFLPKITISENYLKSNDPVAVFSMKLKQGIFTENDFALSTLNSPAAFDNFSTTFQVQQPVFNLDAIYGKSAASLALKAKRESAKRVQKAVSLQVKKTYYGLILAREKKQAMEEAVNSAITHRNDARAAFENGMINQADFLAAEVRVGELQENLIVSNNNIENTSDLLKLILGMKEDVLIKPTDSLSLITSEMPPSFEDLSLARSDLLAMDFQTKAANRNLWMNRSQWVPRLNAFGAVEWNASEAFKKDASNWVVGFQLQWKLFDGFGNLGRSKQASAQRAKSELMKQQAADKAKMEVRQAQRASKAAVERIRVAELALHQAEESLRITEERFKQGLAKASDLLDKEVALTNSKLRYLKAKYDSNIARFELEYALGIGK